MVSLPDHLPPEFLISIGVFGGRKKEKNEKNQDNLQCPELDADPTGHLRQCSTRIDR